MFWIIFVVVVFWHQMREGKRGEQERKFRKWQDFSRSISMETRADRWRWVEGLFWEIICNGNMLSVREKRREKKQLEIAYRKLRLVGPQFVVTSLKIKSVVNINQTGVTHVCLQPQCQTHVWKCGWICVFKKFKFFFAKI